MNCAQVRELLGAYTDGELDVVRSLEVEQHLRECGACARAHEQLRALRSALAASLPYHKASAALGARIRAAVGAEAAGGDRGGSTISRPGATHATATDGRPAVRRGLYQVLAWRPMSLAAAAAIVIVAGLVWALVLEGWSRRTPVNLLAEEVVSSHVRSLMADHLTDVPSSDQHTIKPWFQGKLDFAPEVPDLSGKGFVLVGGRLDYIDHRPVAALVYRHGGHMVNLFQWPAPSGAADRRQVTTRDGYSVAHWIDRDSGLTCWAVTDADRQVLQDFTY